MATPRETSSEILVPSEPDALWANRIHHFDDWLDWYYTDIMNMWDVLREYRERTGNDTFILDTCTFEEFGWFCFVNSSKFRSSFPSI